MAAVLRAARVSSRGRGRGRSPCGRARHPAARVLY